VLSVSAAFGIVFLLIGRHLLLGRIAGMEPSPLLLSLWVLAGVFGCLSLIAGAWLITRPEPALRRAAGEPHSRRLVRVLVFVPMLLVGLAVVRRLPAAAALALLFTFPIAAFSLWYAKHLLRRAARPGWSVLAMVGSLSWLSMFGFVLLFVGLGAIGNQFTGTVPSTTQASTVPAEGEDPEDADSAETAGQGEEPQLNASEQRIFTNLAFPLFIPLPTAMAVVFICLTQGLLVALRSRTPEPLAERIDN
jgi:hypothetical protein